MRTSKYSSSSNGFSQRAQAVEPPPIAWLMEQKLKYPALISLAAGFTDPDTLPDKETMQIMHQMAKSKAVMRTTLQSGTGSGRKRLRELTGQRIAVSSASTASWVALGYLVIASLVAYTAYVWLLGNAPMSLVATYAYINPVVAVFLGWLVVGEPITLDVFIGVTIVVGGVVLVVSGERRPTPIQEPS